MEVTTSKRNLLDTKIKSKVQNECDPQTTDIIKLSAHNWATNGIPSLNGQPTVSSATL
jgi:hypothetical protein